MRNERCEGKRKEDKKEKKGRERWILTLVQAVVSIPAFRHTVTTTYWKKQKQRGKYGY